MHFIQQGLVTRALFTFELLIRMTGESMGCVKSFVMIYLDHLSGLEELPYNPYSSNISRYKAFIMCGIDHGETQI